MKIKTTKKLNLPELIQYVWEKEDYPNRFVNNFNGEVVFNGLGKFVTGDSFIIHNSLFTVEVEEELTMFTHLEDMVEVLFDDTVIDYRYTSISDIQGNQTSEIYVAQNGKLHLIWSAEHGIPADGVLEVSE